MSYQKLPKIVRPARKVVDYDPSRAIESLRDKSLREAIQQAVEVGYIVYPSKQLIWEIYSRQSDFNKDYYHQLAQQQQQRPKSKKSPFNVYEKILFLNLQNVPIIEIGDISICSNLRILNLSCNYLSRIDALVGCCGKLMRLDLHQNQLEHLPDGEFWSQFEELVVLYLHNNQISKLDNLQNLANCCKLEILTMFDTPISLSKNYRHHVVNSVITLKALDDYIVSDEEIIEDADFRTSRYRTKSKHLRVNLILEPSEKNSFRSELELTYNLLANINHIMAHLSPVLIIQKLIRGHLARKRIKKLKLELRILAAVAIQIWWRRLKNKKRPKLVTNKVDVVDTSASHHQDQNRPQKLSATKKQLIEQVVSSDKGVSSNESAGSGLSQTKRSLVIDLNKLNKLQSLIQEKSVSYNEPSLISSTRDVITFVKGQDSFGKKALNAREKLTTSPMTSHSIVIDESNFRIYWANRLTRSFSMDFDDTARRSTSDETDDETNGLVSNSTQYRLLKLDNTILVKSKDEYIYDVVHEKMFGSRSVREMKAVGHQLIKELNTPRTIEQKDRVLITNDQRFFQKVYANMTFGSLQAVDRAYDERDEEEREKKVKKLVDAKRETYEETQQQLAYSKTDKIGEIKQKENDDRALYETRKNKLDDEKIEMIRLVREGRERLLERQKERKKDFKLAIDFSKQHLSVSKALQRHEFLTMRDSRTKKNSLLVVSKKSEDEAQKEMVKKYMEKRNLLRMAQAASEREWLENRLKEEVKSAKDESRVRVETLRSLRDDMAKKSAIKPASATTVLFYDFTP